LGRINQEEELMSESTSRWIVIVLTIVTAAIHLSLGVGGVIMHPDTLCVLFILNALGYLALLAALFLNVPFFKDHRLLAHYLLIAFATVTFIAFFIVNFDILPQIGIAAIIAKADELLLIAVTSMRLRVIRPAATTQG
jgi:hypothetical protein